MSICIIVAMQLKTNILKKRNSRAGKEITGQVNTKKKNINPSYAVPR